MDPGHGWEQESSDITNTCSMGTMPLNLHSYWDSNNKQKFKHGLRVRLKRRLCTSYLFFSPCSLVLRSRSKAAVLPVLSMRWRRDRDCANDSAGWAASVKKILRNSILPIPQWHWQKERMNLGKFGTWIFILVTGTSYAHRHHSPPPTIFHINTC